MSEECGIKKFGRLKITVVGNSAVGKSPLLRTFVENKFSSEYIPTVFDNFEKTVKVGGEEFHLTMWDTSGLDNYDKLRPLSYPETDCFILCYDITCRSSFANIEGQWIREVRLHCPKAAVILVGTKSDLRETTESQVSQDIVTESEGKEMADRIKANGFVECSAKTMDNLDSVFTEAIRAIERKSKLTNQSESKCSIV